MSSKKTYDETSRARDNVRRGVKQSNYLGTATFLGFRAADPFLQYGILSHGWANSLIQKAGGGVLPKGPPLITNTPFDSLGLSPYRSILFAMSVGSMLKQNTHLLTVQQEEMPPAGGVVIGVLNAVLNSLNSVFFICSQTSASANGEHFPQTPLIVGSTLYAVGLFTEWFSEVQRAAFKRKPENKGKVYDGGLFGLSRHVNYLGYTMWRTGYAMAAGGWTWGATVAAIFTNCIAPAWLLEKFSVKAIVSRKTPDTNLLGQVLNAARALLVPLSPDNNTISPSMNIRPRGTQAASISGEREIKHSQEQETRDLRNALPHEEIAEPILADEPKAEDLTVLPVDRKWIFCLRAAARDFPWGQSVR
ncbi:hypothetical protein D0864_11293 [Hortaea werneckii]|uniref:Uncharacterized protein n=1 Tax=Hortaea werneckii TaxID=91943 RepID=A0A3M7DXK2_HORWE|nr:hypothetical protein D0864_11293 [Hortaea werneckii]